jgi:chromosome segregation ATPase
MEQKYIASVHSKEELQGTLKIQSAMWASNLNRSEVDRQQRVNELTHELTTARTRESQHRAECEAAIATELQLHQRCGELTTTHTQLQQTHAALQRTAADSTAALQMRISALEAKAYNLNLQLRSTQIHTAGLKMRVKQREQQIASTEQKALADAAEFERAKTSWSEEIHVTKEKLIVALKQARAQAEEIRSLHAEIHANKSELSTLQDQLRFFKLQQPTNACACTQGLDRTHTRSSLPTPHTAASQSSWPDASAAAETS